MDRSLRERGKRRPGKQPGDPGVTMRLAGDPDESYDCPPAACRRCGAGLAGEPVTASWRHQVTDTGPPPEPKVTHYVAQAKECPCCGTVTEGELPAHVRARAMERANLSACHTSEISFDPSSGLSRVPAPAGRPGAAVITSLWAAAGQAGPAAAARQAAPIRSRRHRRPPAPRHQPRPGRPTRQ
jgi:hypothetical protein